VFVVGVNPWSNAMKKSKSQMTKTNGCSPSGLGPGNERRRPDSYFDRTRIALDIPTSATRSALKRGVRFAESLDTIHVVSLGGDHHVFEIVTPSGDFSIEFPIHLEPGRTRAWLESTIKDEIRKRHGDEMAERFERIKLLVYHGEIQE
jgi:hypothetical protein